MARVRGPCHATAGKFIQLPRVTLVASRSPESRIGDDPKVPPLPPPQITYDQAKSLRPGPAQGRPEVLGLVWQSVKEGTQGILPSRH